MADRFQVSQSKVKKWRMCRYAYHCRYVDHLKRKTKTRPLQFGTMVHEMLEEDAEGRDPFLKIDEWKRTQGKMFAAEREMYGDILEDIAIIMEAYFDYYENDPIRFLKFQGRRAEHEFAIPIDEEIEFIGKIDAIAKTPNKLRWIVENKTFTRAPGDDDRWRNIQSAVYLRACEMLGMKPFDGMLWNYVKSKAPKYPEMLAKGGLSIRDIDTLPSVVMKVIMENNLKPEDNKVLLERAERNIQNYFFRVYTPVNRQIVDVVFQDFVDTAREAMECHGKKTDRNIGMHCSWCDYEPICRAELTGADADFVREREYDNGEADEVDTPTGGSD